MWSSRDTCCAQNPSALPEAKGQAKGYCFKKDGDGQLCCCSFPTWLTNHQAWMMPDAIHRPRGFKHCSAFSMPSQMQCHMGGPRDCLLSMGACLEQATASNKSRSWQLPGTPVDRRSSVLVAHSLHIWCTWRTGLSWWRVCPGNKGNFCQVSKFAGSSLNRCIPKYSTHAETARAHMPWPVALPGEQLVPRGCRWGCPTLQACAYQHNEQNLEA